MMERMTLTRKYYCLIFLLFLISAGVNGQTYGVGGGLIYNFPAKGIGLDLRTEHIIKQIKTVEVAVSPQISYYPWFNESHEFYLGASAHITAFQYDSYKLYGLSNVSYNGWINHSDFGTDTRFSKLGFELGIGVTTDWCTRPFIEYRYNFIRSQANIRAGVIFTINCDRRGMVPCSKIPPPPSPE